MAITAAQLTALTDYTWAQIKLACKTAMVNSLLGGTVIEFPGGRKFERVGTADIQSIYAWADTNEAMESDTSGNGGLILATFGDER